MESVYQSKTLSLEDAVKIIREKLPYLKKFYGVRKIAIFGSFARKEQKEDSDIDLIVELEPVKTGFDISSLSQYLTDLLGIKVDITTIGAIKPIMVSQILKEAIIVRDPRIYIEDALESVEKILKYTKGMSFEDFIEDDKVKDAVERRFQIIGDAVKNIPESIKDKYPEIPWKSVAGFRDFIVHEYFGIDYSRMWMIIKKELPQLKKVLNDIIGSFET